MRTTFLLTLALAIGTLAFGQSRDVKKIDKNIKNATELKNVFIEKTSTNIIPTIVKQTPKSSRALTDLESFEIGTSGNAYGFLEPNTVAIDFDKASGCLVFTHRGGGTNAGAGTTGNHIVTTVSSDAGATWTHHTAYKPTAPAGNPRYPSGVIFNPNNSTNLDEVLSVVAGPATGGSGWTDTYFSSLTINGGSLNSTSVASPAALEALLVRAGMVATNDGKVRIAGSSAKNVSGHDYAFVKPVLFTGTYNATSKSFDWEMKYFDVESVLFKTADGKFRGTSDVNVNFTKDGKTGYFWTLGRDSRGVTSDINTCYGGTSPIIWKTDDFGATWQLMDFYDFGKLDAFNNLRKVVSPVDRVIPQFETSYSDESDHYWSTEATSAIDGDGNLHIFSMATSKSSASIDSLDYGWSLEYYHIYQVAYNKTLNKWGARRIDSVNTEAVGPKESPFKDDPDGLGWEHRLQTTVSDDGRVVMLTYSDTDIDFFPQAKEIKRNLNPDLLVWACNIDTEKVTDTMNLTYMQDVGFGEMFYKYVASVSNFENGKYNLYPIYNDIRKSGMNALGEQHIYFLKNVQFGEEAFTKHSPMFVGTKNQVYVNQVSDCYPNPAINSTQIDVNMKVNANVNISVRNMTGQTVSTLNFGSKSVGTHTLEINTSNLAKGVYILTINAGKEQHSKKLIVK